PGTIDPLQVGLVGPGLEEGVAEVPLVVPVTVEFGTRDVISVFTAMRADNWLHHHGDPLSPKGEAIRPQGREACAVAGEGWRRDVAEQGPGPIRRARDARVPAS